MIIETVRLSEKAKTQLSTLKKRTGIQNWNVLCRWALMMSLAEKTIPPHEDITTDSNVEMTWKVFAGQFDEVIQAVTLERAHRDGVPASKLQDFFKLHLHRGISYLLMAPHGLTALFAIKK